MNCAYHPDLESVAFCVTCGRALCVSCRRDVEGSVYCETCLADMVRGGAPASPRDYQHRRGTTQVRRLPWG